MIFERGSASSPTPTSVYDCRTNKDDGASDLQQHIEYDIGIIRTSYDSTYQLDIYTNSKFSDILKDKLFSFPYFLDDLDETELRVVSNCQK